MMHDDDDDDDDDDDNTDDDDDLVMYQKVSSCASMIVDICLSITWARSLLSTR